jgi:hypothetical protein
VNAGTACEAVGGERYVNAPEPRDALGRENAAQAHEARGGEGV